MAHTVAGGEHGEVPRTADKGPHFRIYADKVELGAGWQKTSE
nr:DUF736 family protein [Rhizobium viscosum]